MQLAPKHMLEKVFKYHNSLWKRYSYVMQITNLCKASFMLGFHKYWLHFLYSFSKIMLLLNR